jgi:CBS domain containing-hemolysin-like protein
MKFFGIATFALAAFTGLVSAIDSTTVKNDINRLTELSDSTNQMVTSINVANFALKAPQVGRSIVKIVDLIYVVVQDFSVSVVILNPLLCS